jgi:hypothetical protein
MPKIYKIKVYYTEFEKGQPVSLVQLDEVFTFKDLHQFLIEKGMKVNLTIGPFRDNLVKYFEEVREWADDEDEATPDEETHKYIFLPKGVKRYGAKYGYAVEVLDPATSTANDE